MATLQRELLFFFKFGGTRATMPWDFLFFGGGAQGGGNVATGTFYCGGGGARITLILEVCTSHLS